MPDPSPGSVPSVHPYSPRGPMDHNGVDPRLRHSGLPDLHAKSSGGQHQATAQTQPPAPTTKLLTQQVASKASAEAAPPSKAGQNAGGTLCKTMSDKELIAQILELRNTAVFLAQQRKEELSRWDNAAKQRTMVWFRRSDEEVRDFLSKGVGNTIRVLKELKAENFLPSTAENISSLTKCTIYENPDGVKGAACPTDTIEHRIFLTLEFCELRPTSFVYGTNTLTERESQLSVLVHEVTHFNDVFRSKDILSNIRGAREQAAPDMVLNADSLAGYILGVTN